jgi:hypothetical protein
MEAICYVPGIVIISQYINGFLIIYCRNKDFPPWQVEYRRFVLQQTASSLIHKRNGRSVFPAHASELFIGLVVFYRRPSRLIVSILRQFSKMGPKQLFGFISIEIGKAGRLPIGTDIRKPQKLFGAVPSNSAIGLAPAHLMAAVSAAVRYLRSHCWLTNTLAPGAGCTRS